MRRLGVACLLALAGCDIVLGLKERPDGGVDGPIPTRPDGEPVGCPASYDRILPTTASRYRVVASKDNWANARAKCIADSPGSTHLIVLSNAGEWEAILDERTTYLTFDTWVGLSDLKTENTFQWVTEERTSYASVGRMVPWDVDQPEEPGVGMGDIEDCVAMRVNSGVFHDEKCGADANFICECDAIADDPAR